MHGPSDRVKDVSPWRGGLLDPRVGCSRFVGGELTTFPSSASEEHPLSPVRPPAEEETSAHVPDRSRPSFHRRPAKAADFPKTRCFPPTRPRTLQRIAPPGYPCRPLAHAAHTFSPGWGKVLFEHCKRPRGCYAP